jgi:D-lyxose ketol-isomerase
MTKQELENARKKAAKYLEKAKIVLTASEKKNMEVVDFHLGELERTGLEIVVYVNTERCCAKELILFPHQTCPEHRHPTKGGVLGKEETFRCRWGVVYLYVPGKKAARPACKPPRGSEKAYTIWHEVVLRPGEQYTLKPNTLHWFQAGNQGAIVSEFSTKSTDENDIFTDENIIRV